jgi:DNA-binding winged helix-turn-helix (wHTH) protein
LVGKASLYHTSSMPPTRIKLPKDAGAPRPRASCSFGRFRFDPSQQLLLDGDTPVRLGSRALEILATLLDHAGKVVSRDEILARVWPNSSVEATNLKVHIAALRRALGKHHIETVNGAGYRFVAPLEREQRTRTDLMPVVGRFSARLGVWMLMFGGASAYLMTTIPWPDPQEMAMVTAGLFLIAAAGAVITLNVFTARVILRAEGLELRRLLGRNALQRSDILRVRRSP